jgi:hypothetical protein
MKKEKKCTLEVFLQPVAGLSKISFVIGLSLKIRPELQQIFEDVFLESSC